MTETSKERDKFAHYAHDGDDRVWIQRHHLIWDSHIVTMDVPMPHIDESATDSERLKTIAAIDKMTARAIVAEMEETGETEAPRIIVDHVSVRCEDIPDPSFDDGDLWVTERAQA